MTKGSEFEAVTKSLSRAARSSANGSREARSGSLDRFLDFQRLSNRVHREAEAAVQAWTSWEVINKLLVTESDVHKAAALFQLSEIGNIRVVLANSAILAACRITDAPQKDRATLCRFVEEFEDKNNYEQFTSPQWVLDRGGPVGLADVEAAANRTRIARFLSLVPADWKNLPVGHDPTLSNLRAKILPLRTRALAHALDLAAPGGITIQDIHDFTKLVLNLATDAELVLTGGSVGWDKIHDLFEKEARKFWEPALREHVRNYQKHIRNKQLAGVSG